MKVRYGIATSPPTIDTVGVYFALDNGYFTEQGLNVEVTGFVGGTTAIRALLSRDVEVAESSADTIFLAYQNGAPLKVITSPVARDLNQVVVSKAIPSIKDMAGHRWGISAPNSQGQILANIVLKKNGVDPAKVDFVAIGSPADRVKALLANRIDATTMITFDQQAILDAIAKGDFKLLGAVADEVPDLPDQYEVTRDDVIKSQPDMLTKFVTAEIKGYRWAQANPDKAATLISKYIKEAPAAQLANASKTMADLKVWGVDGGFTLDGVDKAQKLYQELGVLKNASKAGDVATTQFADQAVKALGAAK
ncbi:MAG: ABC transporter substrate-binding protein [Chloroflexota bacterium]